MVEKEFAKQVAKMVRFHRKKAGLTQLELSQFAEIGKTAVFDVEKGKATMKLTTLLRILHVLNIRIEFSDPLMHVFERKSCEESARLCR